MPSMPERELLESLPRWLWQAVIWTDGPLPRRQRTKPRLQTDQLEGDRCNGLHGLVHQPERSQSLERA